MKVALWGVGFVLGLTIAGAFEGLLVFLIDGMSGREMMPRGLGWVAVPIMAGIAGARGLPVLVDHALTARPALLAKIDDRHRRFMIVGAIGWPVALALYWLVEKPYDGYRMFDEDWERFFELLILPVLLYLGIYLAALWAASAPRR